MLGKFLYTAFFNMFRYALWSVLSKSKPDMYLMRKFTRYFLTVCGFLWDSTPIPLKTLHSAYLNILKKAV
jgi:hypothetical protein